MTEWLPDLVLFEESGGNWDKYLQRLYAFFEQDFLNELPSWPGKRVRLKRHPITAGKCATFWHFIQDGAVEADRIPNFRRCERIRWPRPMMEAFDGVPATDRSARIVWWKNVRSGEDRYVLAAGDFSYVVVVADRGDFVLPWTAYCVEREHQRRKLQREYQEYWRAQKG